MDSTQESQWFVGQDCVNKINSRTVFGIRKKPVNSRNRGRLVSDSRQASSQISPSVRGRTSTWSVGVSNAISRIAIHILNSDFKFQISDPKSDYRFQIG